MLMPASLTRSRSREFLAGAASEPLQPRSLPIQRTLVKKHMYYPRGEIPTLFPIVHLFHSKPSHNFFSRWRNRTRGDVMTFFPERNYLDDRPPFLSKPISYFFATRFGYRSPLIVSIIRFDSLPWTRNLFLDFIEKCAHSRSNGFLASQQPLELDRAQVICHICKSHCA